MAIQYWKKQERNEITYSIDRIRLNLQEVDVDGLERFLCTRLEIKKKVKSDWYQYKNMFSLKYDKSEDATLTIGCSFNGNPSDAVKDETRGYIEFNPNKLHCSPLWGDLDTILCYAGSVQLVRWDLAMDIKAEREHLCLQKDRRKYQYHNYNGGQITEYLGCRNKAGFVRFYNKQLESKLATPLVRLELTCSGEWDTSELRKQIPTVIGLDLKGIAAAGLKSHDLWNLKVLSTHPEANIYASTLSPHLKRKLLPYLDAQIKFAMEPINVLINIVHQWDKGEN